MSRPKRRPPAFQFYASEWLSSTSSMTLAERGAYVTLLSWSWDNGPIPNDLTRIANILGVPLSVAQDVWPEVSKHFVARRGRKVIVNRRLEQCFSTYTHFVSEQSRKGQLSAAFRKAKRPPKTLTNFNRGSLSVATEGVTERQPPDLYKDQDPSLSSTQASTSSPSSVVPITPSTHDLRGARFRRSST